MSHPSQQENIIITEALRDALQERYQTHLSEGNAQGEWERIAVITKPGQPNQLEEVRFAPSDAVLDDYRDDGFVVDMARLPEFCENLWRYESIEQAMTYSQWCKVSEFLQPTLPALFLDNPSLLAGFDIDDESGPTHNPPDLPPILAQQRLNSVAKPMNRIEATQAKLELTEIIMANLYGEPVNEGIFSEASLSRPAWAETIKQMGDPGDLMEYGRETLDEIKGQEYTIRQQEAADPNDNGYANAGEYARLLVLQQEARETDHLIDGYWHRAERQAKRQGDDMVAREQYQERPHLDQPNHSHDGDRIVLAGPAAEYWDTLKTQFHQIRSGSIVTTQADLNRTLENLGVSLLRSSMGNAPTETTPNISDQQAQDISQAMDTLHNNAGTLDAADAMSRLNSLIDTSSGPKADIDPHTRQQAEQAQSAMDDWLDEHDTDRPGL